MRGKRRMTVVLLILLAALCSYNVMRAWTVFGLGDDSIRQSLLTWIGAGLVHQAVSVYMPGLLYTEGNAQEETEVLEDESTCESILELNGRTLAERLLEENQEDAVEQENAAAVRTEEQEGSVPVLGSEFDIEHFFVVDPNTTIDAANLSMDQLFGCDLTLKQDASKPQILIYHTHTQEYYADSDEADAGTGVIGLGEYLKQILEQYGYQVIHNTQAFDIMPDGELDRSRAYNQAREGIEQVLEKNPSIEVIIDLHRDGVSEDRHLVTEIDGKQTAQIMYFNGLSYTNESGSLSHLANANKDTNLAFAFRLEYTAEQYFPSLTRCVYLKGYRYNLDLRPKSILLEVGAQTNTMEEAWNAMEPFVSVLDKVLKGDE